MDNNHETQKETRKLDVQPGILPKPKPKKKQGNLLRLSSKAAKAMKKAREYQESIFNAAEISEVGLYRPKTKSDGDPTNDGWAMFTVTFKLEGVSINVRGTVFKDDNGNCRVGKLNPVDTYEDSKGETQYRRNVSAVTDDLWPIANIADKLDADKEYDTITVVKEGPFTVLINKEKGTKFPTDNVDPQTAKALIMKARDYFSKEKWDEEKVRLFNRKERQAEDSRDSSLE